METKRLIIAKKDGDKWLVRLPHVRGWNQAGRQFAGWADFWRGSGDCDLRAAAKLLAAWIAAPVNARAQYAEVRRGAGGILHVRAISRHSAAAISPWPRPVSALAN